VYNPGGKDTGGIGVKMGYTYSISEDYLVQLVNFVG